MPWGIEREDNRERRTGVDSSQAGKENKEAYLAAIWIKQ